MSITIIAPISLIIIFCIPSLGLCFGLKQGFVDGVKKAKKIWKVYERSHDG